MQVERLVTDVADEKKWSWWQIALGVLRRLLNKGNELGVLPEKGKGSEFK